MKIKNYSNLVVFSHTIFAMPFALIGYTYGLMTTNATFNWCILIQVVLCMIFARKTAMGFNRWADREIDAKNPRTAQREIPAGKITPKAALTFTIANAILFTITAATINPLTAILSPVALVVITAYSYCKRFTSLAHIVLGLSLAIAPVGAYIAVAGKFAFLPCLLAIVVMTWCSGFDIIYALQDRDFDIENGLKSIPSKFSVKGALAISSALHVTSAATLIYIALQLPENIYKWIGIAIFIALLIMQHLLVTPTKQRNIGIAFGTTNGVASVILAIFIIINLIVG
ncbi:MAG: 4-hydroxybenzoate octaprenyltransferase [Rikenellaceae bacterium]